jgi:hypothetical protein
MQFIRFRNRLDYEHKAEHESGLGAIKQLLAVLAVWLDADSSPRIIKWYCIKHTVFLGCLRVEGIHARL